MISKKIENWLFPPWQEERKRLQEAAINLFKELPSRKSVKKAILDGKIYVNSEVGETSTWVKKGDVIKLDLEEIKVGEIPEFEGLIYDDKHLCIILKKAGEITSGNHKHTLHNKVLKILNINLSKKSQCSLAPAHRLDKDTHGPVIFYKSKEASLRLGRMFENQEISKKYFALTHGNTSFKSCHISTPINGKSSHSKVKKISDQKLPYIGETSLLKIHPKTGRKHQIRIHLKSLGHQIVGDKIHHGDKVFKGHGMFLCCSGLKFTHPFSNEPISISTPLPRKFHKVLSAADLP